MHTQEVVIKSFVDPDGMTMTAVHFDTSDPKLKAESIKDQASAANAVLNQIAEGLAKLCAALNKNEGFKDPETMMDTMKPLVRARYNVTFGAKIMQSDEPPATKN